MFTWFTESKDCCDCGYFSPDFSPGMSFTAFLMEIDTKGKHSIKEVMLCDRIDSFRSVSHSFPVFERENCGGNCVVWLGNLNAFFFVINCLNFSLGNVILVAIFTDFWNGCVLHFAIKFLWHSDKIEHDRKHSFRIFSRACDPFDQLHTSTRGADQKDCITWLKTHIFNVIGACW